MMIMNMISAGLFAALIIGGTLFRLRRPEYYIST